MSQAADREIDEFHDSPKLAPGVWAIDPLVDLAVLAPAGLAHMLPGATGRRRDVRVLHQQAT